MGFEIDTARPCHDQHVSVNGSLGVSVDGFSRYSSDEEVDTSFTRQCASVKTRLCLPAAPFINQWGNKQIAMLIRECMLSNQLISLPINYGTDVSGGNGVSVSESEASEVSGLSGLARKERVVWLKIRCKSITNPLFLVPKKKGKIQPPAFQSLSVLHPIIIIQHPK